MNRITPLVMLMIVSCVLGLATLMIVSTAYQAAAKRMERDMLQECVTESGHKKVPCE